MSYQSRLSSFIYALGADIKALQNTVNSRGEVFVPYLYQMLSPVGASVPQYQWVAINSLTVANYSSYKGYAINAGTQYILLQKPGLWRIEGRITWIGDIPNTFIRLSRYYAGIIPGSRVSSTAAGVALASSSVIQITSNEYVFIEVAQFAAGANSYYGTSGPVDVDLQAVLQATYLGPG